MLFIVISIVSLTLHKAKESIDQLLNPTNSIYKQTNYSNEIDELELNNAREETQRKIRESEKKIQDNFDRIIEDVRNSSKEVTKQVSEMKKEDIIEMLNQLGITDKQAQEDVINYINQLKTN